MQQPPVIAIPEHLRVVHAKKRRLANGIDLHLLESSEQEVVRVSFIFRAGSSMQSVPFSASATVNLLAEGTNRYTAAEIAEKLDFYGSYYDVSVDRDYVVVTFCSLTKFFAPTMEVGGEILLHPAFPDEHVETYCGKEKQRLTIDRTKVAFRARELFVQTLFGVQHPYGIVSPAEGYDKLSAHDVAAFYRKFYVAERCFVVASGRIDAATTGIIASVAEKIPSGGAVAPPDGFAPPAGKSYAFLPQPGAVQSAIRIGIPLFPRTHPDYIPMQVVATILGGYFGSRLVSNLRGERGYTYGVFAGLVNMEQAGYMAIATEVASAATVDSLDQIFFEMERLRTEPVPAEELQMVKNIMVGEVMRILDGPFGIADVTIENIQNGTDNEYINRLLGEIRAFTPQRVMETACRYLVPENFTTVVVGDESMMNQLRITN